MDKINIRKIDRVVLTGAFGTTLTQICDGSGYDTRLFAGKCACGW